MHSHLLKLYHCESYYSSSPSSNFFKIKSQSFKIDRIKITRFQIIHYQYPQLLDTSQKADPVYQLRPHLLHNCQLRKQYILQYH